MGKRTDPEDQSRKDREIQRMEEDFTEDDYAFLEEFRELTEEFE